MLDSLESEYPIDASRIYATGLSNGGHMCYRMAFDLSDRVAAIAPVGALLSTALRARDVGPRHSMAVLVIAGDADPISPYEGGVVGGGVLRRGEVSSAQDTVQFWIEAGAVTTPTVSEYTVDTAANDGTRARVARYAAASSEVEVVLITIEGGGHTWPGGEQYLPEAIVGRTSRDFSAATVIWEFLKRWRHGG
jgi:polyhydroxybutyrate depolymerase